MYFLVFYQAIKKKKDQINVLGQYLWNYKSVLKSIIMNKLNKEGKKK